MEMSGFTIFIIIVVLLSAILGWRSGFLRQVGRVAGIILGIIACRMYGAQAAAWLINAKATESDKMMYTVLAYVLLFIIVYVLATIIAHLMKSLLNAVHIGVLNRIAGAVFKVCEWLLLISLFLNLWTAISPITSLEDNPVYQRVLWFGPYLLGTDAVVKVSNAIFHASL